MLMMICRILGNSQWSSSSKKWLFYVTLLKIFSARKRILAILVILAIEIKSNLKANERSRVGVEFFIDHLQATHTSAKYPRSGHKMACYLVYLWHFFVFGLLITIGKLGRIIDTDGHLIYYSETLPNTHSNNTRIAVAKKSY